MKQKNLILMVVAVGCGLVAAFLTTQINAKPKIEQVEVWVAKKDLPVGTTLTERDLLNYAVKKPIAKQALPASFVVDEKELIDKRLTRPFTKEEPFVPSALAKHGVITLPDGKDMASLPMNVTNGVAGFVGPGSKVDVLASVKLGNKLEAFPLLIDMLVLAVDTHTSYDNQKGVFPNMSTVSFAVTQEEALLLQLAQRRDCHLSLLLRHPGKPVDPSYDIKKIKKLLEDDRHPAKLVTFDKGDDAPQPDGPAPAPAPRLETTKVLVASVDIPANTDITRDLIEQRFVEREIPKELAEGVITDFTPHLAKVFKTGVARGQWVTEGMIGSPVPKPAPQDHQIDNQPKPEPNDSATPTEPVRPSASPRITQRTHDIYGHTTSGTLIYRYEEVKPGDWKLKETLTPEQLAAKSKLGSDTKPSPGGSTSTEPKKLD
jgi:pilus assembly protein CpaB